MIFDVSGTNLPVGTYTICPTSYVDPKLFLRQLCQSDGVYWWRGVSAEEVDADPELTRLPLEFMPIGTRFHLDPVHRLPPPRLKSYPVG